MRSCATPRRTLTLRPTTIPKLRSVVLLTITIVPQPVALPVDGALCLGRVPPAHEVPGVVATRMRGVEVSMGEELLVTAVARARGSRAVEGNDVVEALFAGRHSVRRTGLSLLRLCGATRRGLRWQTQSIHTVCRNGN